MRNIRIFDTPYILAEKFAEELALMINRKASVKQHFSVALSGGSTPELLFSILAEKYSERIKWEYLDIYWGDERCVAPESKESNFGNVSMTLLRKVPLPEGNIFRIRGENNPDNEADRYADVIKANLPVKDGLPRFDLVILGLGEDGHTASIFPDHKELLDSEAICAVASHPVSQQKRITITGKVLNNADYISFLVTGDKKAVVVEKILKNTEQGKNFPAAGIVPNDGVLEWWLDKNAASLL